MALDLMVKAVAKVGILIPKSRRTAAYVNKGFYSSELLRGDTCSAKDD